jgi:plastocyanin
VRLATTALALASAIVTAAAVALPVSAATPADRAVVGPGFVIKMGKPTKPGTIELVVADRTDAHNFHLTGPGVNVRTSVKAIRTYTFAVTLRTGTYRFVCDPHKTFMKGSFRIP